MKLRYDDRQHAYWIDGKRAKGVTSVAKVPDDRWSLEMWSKRMVAVGLAMTPSLVEAVAAHVDDKESLNSYCEEAITAAKAREAARRGDTIHKITERHDQGLPVVETPLAMWAVQTWQGLLDAAGLEVVPELIERIVIHPSDMIAGRLDRILRRKADGKLVIADCKGGDGAVRYPHSIAVQLSMYANADLLAGELNHRGETETFEPLPDVDRSVGYVLHMPEAGAPGAYEVDIAAGWQVYTEVIRPTFAWRSRRDLIRPVAALEPTEAPDDRPQAMEPVDGLPVGPEAVDELLAEVRASDSSLLMNAWLADGKKAGHLWNPRVRPYERVLNIAKVAARLAKVREDERTETFTALLYSATGTEPQPSIPIGAHLGALTLEQSRKAVAIAELL